MNLTRSIACGFRFLHNSKELRNGILLLASLFFCENAFAEKVPVLVDAYAERFDAECPASTESKNKSTQRNPKFVQRVAANPHVVIWVVDSSYSSCRGGVTLCGTGGCMVGVFRVKNNTTDVLYDDQMFGWSVSGNGRKLSVRLHGGRCGGSGPEPCAATIDLLTGSMRTFVPTN